MAATHAAVAAGDASMVVALADSVLFSLDADAARSRVLLFIGISFVPFLVVAPLIGPVIDRMRGGRRLVIQVVLLTRVLLSLAMANVGESLLLFPLAFGAMVGQKTYTISKSALVPAVVRTEDDLVEANSKLGLISGIVAVIAVGPAAVLQLTAGPTATLWYSAVMFLLAFVAASRLPRERLVEQEPVGRRSVEFARTVVDAARAMTLARAAVGFTFFHLFFWFRYEDAGLAWFGFAMAVAALFTMAGNAVSPFVRERCREETMLIGALVLIGAVGVGLAVVDLGLMGGVLLAGAVNAAAAVARLAFEAIVQRDAPEANRGQAFARFETRFQLAWVTAGVLAVIVSVPGRFGVGRAGFVVVGLLGAGAALRLALSGRSHRVPRASRRG